MQPFLGLGQGGLGKALERTALAVLRIGAVLRLAIGLHGELALGEGRVEGRALQRSANENIRGYATRIIADANYDASALRLSSAEAGVSYAPDGSMGPKTQQLLAQLNTLQGPAFDTAFAQGQLAVQTDCEAQYGAYSQNGKSGPLKRFAQVALPKAQGRLELARRLAGGR